VCSSDLLVRLQIGDLEALGLQLLHAVENGVVLHGGGDDVPSPLAHALDGAENGPVVRFRTAGGKKYPIRLSAQSRGYLHPAGPELSCRLNAEGIQGAGISPAGGKGLGNGLHCLPAGLRCGGVVKINHGFSLSNAKTLKNSGGDVLPDGGTGDLTHGLLERLKAAGVRLYTATSKPTVVVTPILHEQGLAGYFDFIGGASEDKSVDTKTAVMRMVLDRPELQGARVLMVGDRKDDMHGAADCGVPAVAVMYGYGSEQEVAPFAPVLMAQNCQQLADYILNVE